MPEIQLPDAYAASVRDLSDQFRARFDAAFALRDPQQAVRARALLSRIGTIDWASEGYASPDNQRDLSIRFHWGHDHRFGDDLAVRGRMGIRHLRLMAEFLTGFGLPEDHFRGRRILDVGCWTGGTTLTLKMLGAAEILAIDEVRKYAEAAHELVNGVLGLSDVDCRAVSLYALDEGRFDTVYVPGVVYHLSDPVLGLRRMFNRLEDGGDIFVESATFRSDKPVCLFEGNRVFHKDGSEQDLSRGGWNWFLPSASCLELWMREAGFDDVRVFHSPETQRVFGYGIRREFRQITRAGLSVPDIA
ncbi:DUF1698 domain-containing protein [Paracoccus spongiarum]|uniref:DUF1698 domain-containing protein n=1 Tax=Paracoccus spongiarum TaxID=3064387 RepID=A0ABT9JCK3_9RHOB|nr:DUF1698 domain-containing protein [Paracoccus sp. 2205BS29-5]MDP5307542.1 DUF1698 domain-containing protein [Paracoccus sp. 2205BS29-5]